MIIETELLMTTDVKEILRPPESSGKMHSLGASSTEYNDRGVPTYFSLEWSVLDASIMALFMCPWLKNHPIGLLTRQIVPSLC